MRELISPHSKVNKYRHLKPFFCHSQGEENTKRHEVEGKVVMVTEHRVFDGGNRRGNIAIRVSIT